MRFVFISPVMATTAFLITSAVNASTAVVVCTALMALLISRCEPGKRERRFPMGASLCFAESAMRYLLPPAHWGCHLQGAAGVPRSPLLCQGSRPLTGQDARPPGCAQMLPGHAFPRQAKRQHCDLRSLGRRLGGPTHVPAWGG